MVWCFHCVSVAVSSTLSAAHFPGKKTRIKEMLEVAGGAVALSIAARYSSLIVTCIKDFYALAGGEAPAIPECSKSLAAIADIAMNVPPHSGPCHNTLSMLASDRITLCDGCANCLWQDCRHVMAKAPSSGLPPHFVEWFRRIDAINSQPIARGESPPAASGAKPPRAPEPEPVVAVATAPVEPLLVYRAAICSGCERIKIIYCRDPCGHVGCSDCIAEDQSRSCRRCGVKVRAYQEVRFVG